MLDTLGLTDAQRAARDGKLTASRVGVLMNGDEQAVMDLWLEMTGQKEPDDLSDVFPVALGSHTEPLNLSWVARRDGIEITDTGLVIVRDWAACTLDGRTVWNGTPAVIDAKHVNAFSKIEEVEARYWPQMHWQMWLAETRLALLSVIRGTTEPQIVPIAWDQGYFDELHSRASAFMECVKTLTPPSSLPEVVPVDATKTVDMTGSNAWADAAARWMEKKPAADDWKKADKALKDAVPDDAKRAFGHGVEINRAKNGALRVKEMKDA